MCFCKNLRSTLKMGSMPLHFKLVTKKVKSQIADIQVFVDSDKNIVLFSLKVTKI